MKKFIIAICLTVFTAGVNAQSTLNEEVDAIQAVFGKEKKELIASLITLTPEESAKFWPIYDQYEVERKQLGKERVNLIVELADAYKTMTPEKADAVTQKAIDLGKRNDKLLEKYYNSMKKAVGSVNAMEFYQAELYFLTEMKAAFMDQIPLYSEVKTLN
jgi:Spy/CpxP family protein refolding chaperone